MRRPRNRSGQYILRPCAVLLPCWECPPQWSRRVVLPPAPPAVDALPRLTPNTPPLHAYQGRLLHHHPPHFRSHSRLTFAKLPMAAATWQRPLTRHQRRRSFTRGPLLDREYLFRPFTILLHNRKVLQIHPLLRARRRRDLRRVAGPIPPAASDSPGTLRVE